LVSKKYSDNYLKEKCNDSLETLARIWGPICYQYIELGNAKETKKDLLCPVNFGAYQCTTQAANDKSDHWNTKIVRQRLASANLQDLVPIVYYSVAITDTHYYILYCFYHADDDDHPNDMEGVLVILDKNNGAPKLFGVITVAHYDFIPYVYEKEDVDRIVLHPLWQKEFTILVDKNIESQNILIQQEKGKHGMYALGRNVGIRAIFGRRLKEIFGIAIDSIVYYPGTEATIPEESEIFNVRGTRHYPQFYYVLVDIHDKCNGLFDKLSHAKTEGNETFTPEGAFYNTETSTGQANGPWLWDHIEVIDKIEKGDLWNHPARLVKQMFRVNADFDDTYRKKMDSENRST